MVCLDIVHIHWIKTRPEALLNMGSLHCGGRCRSGEPLKGAHDTVLHFLLQVLIGKWRLSCEPTSMLKDLSQEYNRY
jgi:hypothetical protein